MRRELKIPCVVIGVFLLIGCSTAYQATPLSFRAPSAYPNAQTVGGATVAAKAFSEADEAKSAFGFDVRGAGMLPVQVVFDNQGPHPMEINAAQTFLEDQEGNLWPILSRDIAYERATKYAQTKEIFKEGAYGGFLGATAGAVIGAAIGVVTGNNILETAGKGAAVGAAGGSTIGGVKGYGSEEARRKITDDLNQKSLESKAIEPGSLGYGFLFFPGEAKSARLLRLKLTESDTSTSHLLILNF
jgi:hypothetical protein